VWYDVVSLAGVVPAAEAGNMSPVGG
jgi:hypothetical protein